MKIKKMIWGLTQCWVNVSITNYYIRLKISFLKLKFTIFFFTFWKYTGANSPSKTSLRKLNSHTDSTQQIRERERFQEDAVCLTCLTKTYRSVASACVLGWILFRVQWWKHKQKHTKRFCQHTIDTYWHVSAASSLPCYPVPPHPRKQQQPQQKQQHKKKKKKKKRERAYSASWKP